MNGIWMSIWHDLTFRHLFVAHVARVKICTLPGDETEAALRAYLQRRVFIFFFEKVRFRKGGLKWIRIGVWCHFFNQLWSQWIMVHDVSNIFFHSRMSSFPLTFTPSFFKMGTASTTKQYQPWIQSAHDCGSRMGRVVWHPKAGILGLFFTRFDVSTETRGKTTRIRDSDRFGDFFTFKWKGSR